MSCSDNGVITANPDSNSELMSVADWWHRNMQIDLIGDFLQERGIEAAALLNPPTGVPEDGRTYCPRCHQTYNIDEGHCDDCFGVDLLPLEQSAAPAARAS